MFPLFTNKCTLYFGFRCFAVSFHCFTSNIFGSFASVSAPIDSSSFTLYCFQQRQMMMTARGLCQVRTINTTENFKYNYSPAIKSETFQEFMKNLSVWLPFLNHLFSSSRKLVACVYLCPRKKDQRYSMNEAVVSCCVQRSSLGDGRCFLGNETTPKTVAK